MASLKQNPPCPEAKASDLIENVCQCAEYEITQVENGIFGCSIMTELAARGCYDKFSELPCSKIQLSKQRAVLKHSEKCHSMYDCEHVRHWLV